MFRRDSTAKWIVIGAAVVVLIAAAELVLGIMANHATVQIGTQLIHVQVANTDSQRVQGLSGTSSLQSGDGMLFIFGQSAKWPIWMKDMHYSIDIIWLDQSYTVIDIARNVSPSTYPETFAPNSPARYVLELPANYATTHNIEDGTLATFNSFSF